MRVCVTGGNGYVGSKLLPALLDNHYQIKAIDLTYETVSGLIRGDIRSKWDMRSAMQDCDAMIHLACISNDPTFDMDPRIGKSINQDCFPMIVEEAKKAGIKRFIYASSSSVYGVKTENNVTEDLPLGPMTGYAECKAACEKILLESKGNMEAVVVRPATICGYSPNMRLDLLVHILTHHAVKKGVITVLGGSQYRPNIHIDDMVDCYMGMLEAPVELIDGEIFNAGYRNMTILETAELVRGVVGDVDIITKESTDPRSYHVNSDKIKRVLGFEPKRTVESAIKEVAEALRDGRIFNADDDKYYRNRSIKKMGLVA